MTDGAPPRWRKSSRSASQSDCVEIAQTFDRIRDSKHKDAELMVGRAGWTSFLTAAKSGEFGKG
ncbi:DUF397 domain-containing protein [Lentzea cavernae]|uniref:DUF397 domain-containing protein n=1 Tax=Lentzea cavernae TaxID=2020703 RepID=A0ABQ3MUF7_9PSEU|nr:DUF397 domain-containing protein [Lentzea cavernae]GHH57749.1 hypothetical protein GCM10017774_77910 [Lentzea cavernae]